MAQWAETCRRIFNFLISITNICCVNDEIILINYRKTQRDGSYQKIKNCLLQYSFIVGHNSVTIFLHDLKVW